MLQNKLLKLGRTFQEGMTNFYRNGWLSFATVSVLAISLYIISVTIILGITANMVLKNIQNQINVSVYFNPDVTQQQIMDIKNTLAGYREIKSIGYVSKDQALAQFEDMGKNNPSIAKAISEVGENPLLDALVIKANSPDQYDTIVNAIGNSDFKDQVSSINYQQNKTAIDRLSTIMKLVEQIGLTMGIVFVFIGVLITFNAIRLTMYAQKQEFEVKRLVGSSNVYIQMPFIFEGIFYGLGSALLVMILLAITSKYIAPLTRDSIPQGDLMHFYFANFFKIFGLMLLSGIGLGVFSSFIAIRRYLKI